MAKSTRAAAMASKTTHSVVQGHGYVQHAFPPVLRAVPLAPPCNPPPGAMDGETHMLCPPNGGEALAFTWVARELAWERPGGNRLAWTAAYLGSHGWSYGGPRVAEEALSKKRAKKSA